MSDNKQHTAEFEKCVQQVMEQGHEKGSAFAICTKSFQDAGKPIFIGESEKQKLHLFCESFKLEGNKVSGVAIHPKRLFHPEEQMTHVYLKEELEKAAPTLAGKPFGIDHVYILPPPNMITKSWYCADENGVCFEGFVDDYIAEKIRKKAFKGISIELDWLRPGGSVEYVNGVAAKNFELTSLHLLQKFPPADVDAFIKLWNSIQEQLVVAPPKPLDEQLLELRQDFENFRNEINERLARIEGALGQVAVPPSPLGLKNPAKAKRGMRMKEQNQNQEPPKCPEGQVRDPETGECVPKAPEEPTIKEQQGNEEPERDEHGCEVGKERWNAETEKCVPIETVKEQQGEETDAHKRFMAQCLESGKTMEQCAAEWKQKHEGGETQTAQAESIVSLRKKLVEVEAALTKFEKQQKRKVASWKEKYERLLEAVKGAIPPPRIWKSWTPGPQRYVQENLKILREVES